MNFVYIDIEEGNYQNLKSFLGKKIGIPKQETVQYCIEALKFSNSNGSLAIRYYKTKKLTVQGDLRDIDNIVKEIEEQLGIVPENSKRNFPEQSINKDFFLGFDESGKGETFGSLFLGGVKIEKKDLEYLKGMFGSKNVKRMDKIQIENLFNAIKNKFSYEIIQMSPKEIDSLQINILLDRGYIELIKKLNKESRREALFLDDYGVGYELKSKFNDLEREGSFISVSQGADEEYLASSLASLISRRARLIELENLSKEHVIIDPQTGEKVLFNNGSPANPETEKYLMTYRKLYPFSDFPPFVRTKWGNVREIETRFPKQVSSLSFKCKYCNEESYKICMFYDNLDKVTECFCPRCCKKIDTMELKGFFKNKEIIIDTSVIISRIISKDLETKKHLEKCSFVIPSILYDELDSKQPTIKLGGMREIEDLRKLHDAEEIKLSEFDVEDYSEVKNDKKFLRILRSKNGVMLTKDSNLANFSEIKEFVIHIIDNKESYIKKIGLI